MDRNINSNLTKRMQMVAGFIPPHFVIADIGCDHAYVSIAAALKDPSRKVLAMDVRPDPLKIARENIREFGLEDQIEIRLSNGFEALKKDESDCAVIAGMGGQLMHDILANGLCKMHDGYVLILSPQSEPELVRGFLREHGFTIETEDMCFDKGKYYIAIRAVLHLEDVSSRDINAKDEKSLLAEDALDQYGACLIGDKNPVLIEFVKREEEKLLSVQEKLGKMDSQSAKERYQAVTYELEKLGFVKDALKK